MNNMGNCLAKLSAALSWNKVPITKKLENMMEAFAMEKWMFQKLWDIFVMVDLDGDRGIDSMELCLWMERCQCVIMDDISSLTASYYEGFKCIDDHLMWERNVLVPSMRMRSARSLTFEEFCGVIMTICVSDKDDLIDMQYLAACRGKVEVTVENIQESFRPYFMTLAKKKRHIKIKEFSALFGTFDLTRVVKKFELRDATNDEKTEFVIEPMRALQKIIQSLSLGVKNWKKIQTKIFETVDRKHIQLDTPLKVISKVVSPKIRTTMVISDSGRKERGMKKKPKNKSKAWKPKRFRKRKPRTKFNDPNPTFVD